jgi:molecular chaperone Hsp33
VAESERPDDDLIQPFIIERSGIRGRLVRLGEVVDTIVTRPDYPTPVARLLGEFLALSAVLASTLKYDGIFTLQISGDGPIRTLVADMTSEGELRGYAGYDEAAVAAVATDDDADDDLVRRWLGQGQMVFTVDQGDHTKRYQGMVELNGPGLADCLLTYFRQSQQLNAGILVAAERQAAGWRSAALLIEQIPEAADTEDAEIGLEDWRRALILMASCTEGELLDPALSEHELLYRLFHEDGVRVYRPREVRVGCRCSPERVAEILQSLPRDEVEDCMVEGEVVMTCEFCAVDFRFDAQALDRLYATAEQTA